MERRMSVRKLATVVGRSDPMTRAVCSRDWLRWRDDLIDSLASVGYRTVWRSLGLPIVLSILLAAFVAEAQAEPADAGAEPARSAAQGAAAAADINSQIARITPGKTTPEETVRILGEPQRYFWGKTTFTKDRLPSAYIMAYDGFSVVMNNDRVTELRIERRPDFLYRDKLRLGSALEEVLEVLGQPEATVEGQPCKFEDGTVYKDIDGKKGRCYYSRRDKGVRMFFGSYRLTAIYLVAPGEPTGSLQTVRPVSSVDEYDDVRWKDLSKLDLSGREGLPATLKFNEKTVWPESAKMPKGVDPNALMAQGMNPGLGIREHHQKGINGQGVSVAIIDYPLYQDHPEFAGKIEAYRDMGCQSESSMHGPAVVSLLVGKNCGTAPGAKVYYVAIPDGTTDSSYHAKGLRWLIEKNKELTPAEKIRVVSVSAAPSGEGSPYQKNMEQWDAACADAEKAGILVLDCTAHRGFIGPCWYDPKAPEDARQCTAGFPGRPPERYPGRILVPNSRRTTAEEYTKGECSYAYCGRGGLSWSIPYCAGVLAMGWQLRPEFTPQQMRELLFQSAIVKDQDVRIICPWKFIDMLQTIHAPVAPPGGARGVPPDQIVSEEVRSAPGRFRQATIARHKGLAAEATKEYEAILRESAGREGEIFDKSLCNLYLAEVASDMLKDKPLAEKTLRDGIVAIDKVDIDRLKLDDGSAAGYRILRNWASYELARLKGENGQLPDPAGITKADMTGIWMLAMVVHRLSLEGTGLSLEQLAETDKSRIDRTVARLMLVFGSMHQMSFFDLDHSSPEGKAVIQKAEGYISGLEQDQSYLAPYARLMLEEVRKQAQQGPRHPPDESGEVARKIKNLGSDDRTDRWIAVYDLAHYADKECYPDPNEPESIRGAYSGLNVVKRLDQAQKDPDKRMRRGAAIALAHTRQTSIKPDAEVLLEAITDREDGLAQEALEAMTGPNPPTIKPQHISALLALARQPKDRNLELDRGQGIAQTIGTILADKPDVGVAEVLKLLGDANPQNRERAWIILEEMGPGAKKALPELAKYLDDENPMVRRRCLTAMRKIDREEADAIIKAKEQEKDAAAATRIRELGPQIPGALEKFRHPDFRVRQEGINFLVGLGPKVAPHVVGALADDDINVRRSASWVFGDLKWEESDIARVPKDVVSALMTASRDEDLTVRHKSQEALCKLHVVEAIPIYVEMLQEQDRVFLPPEKVGPLKPGSTRPTTLAASPRAAEAAEALAAIGPAAKAAVPALKELASSDRSYVGNEARTALLAIDEEHAVIVSEMIEQLKSGDKQARQIAMMLLGDQGREAREAIPVLMQILREELGKDPTASRDAVMALGQLQASEAIPVFMDLIKEQRTQVGSTELVWQAIQALGNMGEAAKPAIPMILDILKDKNEDTTLRGAAACALGNLQADEAIPVLITIVKQKGELFSMDADALVRRHAAGGLARMGKKARNAIPVLKEAMNDEDEEVRRSAAEALQAIEKGDAEGQGRAR